MPLSSWRGIYKYYYDTDAPHLRPWEMLGFVEKPTYTYYSNAGIYLICKDIVKKYFKSGAFFNATDLMESLVRNGDKLVSHPVNGYWLDIGKHEDYIKAQNDLKKATEKI
jgi:NDP-sugar pyrophosphorylase family protein